MKKILILSVFLIFAGCASDPNTNVAAIGTGLTAAIVAADGYFKLPRCGREQPCARF